MFWRLMLFYTHLLLLLQPSVLWLSIVSFNNDAKLPPKSILREFDVSRIGHRLGGLPHLERLHGKIWPRLRGSPGLADRATRLGGSPYLSCKRDQIKMRDYMNRRVTAPKRVPSPTWGPPPPCKQALTEMRRNCWCGVSVEWIVRGLSMFFKTFTKHAFSFTYVLYFVFYTL